MNDINDILSTRVLEPLASQLVAEHSNPTGKLFKLILDLNRNYPGGKKAALSWIAESFNGIDKDPKNIYHPQYSFLTVTEPLLTCLLKKDVEEHGIENLAIHKVWLDFVIKAL